MQIGQSAATPLCYPSLKNGLRKTKRHPILASILLAKKVIMQIQKTATLAADKYTESILVVPTSTLFPHGAWNGLKKVDCDSYLYLIEKNKEFIARGVAETDPSYKQIIPYLVFTHNNHYFIMQRKASSTEQRLANKYSLGIGGHLREEDMEGSSIIEWAQREFHEEISYTGSVSITPLGLLNDDSNEVGKVHAGFVFLLEGDSDQISIKSELQHGYLATLDECKVKRPLMETWSQYVLDYLTKS